MHFSEGLNPSVRSHAMTVQLFTILFMFEVKHIRRYFLLPEYLCFKAAWSNQTLRANYYFSGYHQY